ncbi:MAG: nucleoside phosphorylase [bacterium]|nr:nucleoside phosphorylase [bacterium]
MTSSRSFGHSNNPGFACAERVLLLPFGRESYLPAMVERWGGEAVPMDETTDRIVYRLETADESVTLVYTGMGAPATANGLEMIVANGGKWVVVLGACGGVVPEVAVGDLIVAEEAVRGEGTSRYYASQETAAECDLAMTEALWKAARDTGYSEVHRGKVYTTDAGYRQGSEIYDGRHGRVLGVECECSAAAIVARTLGLQLGTILFVTDNVTLAEERDRKYRGLKDSRVRSGFEAASSAAVEALLARA